MRGDTCVGAAKTEGYVNFACYKRRRLRGDTCVGAAKTERDVNFACYKPRAIAGGGGDGPRVSQAKTEKGVACETLCIVVWAHNLRKVIASKIMIFQLLFRIAPYW